MTIDKSLFQPCMIVGVTGRNEILDGFGDIERATVAGLANALNDTIATHIAVCCDLGDGAGLITVGMGAQGIERNSIDHYGDGSQEKIVFLGHHPAFNEPDEVSFGNAYLKHCWDVHEGYGYLTLLKFWLEPIGIKVPDNANRPICSELPRNMLRSLNIPYPADWDDRCSPWSWQQWKTLNFIEGFYK
jgi:hypothetical protein